MCPALISNVIGTLIGDELKSPSKGSRKAREETWCAPCQCWLSQNSKCSCKTTLRKKCKHFSNITLRRALREVGLGACVQQKKPLLAKRHVIVRLTFAHKYKNWTVDD
jgi:hypothetical protein